MTLCPSCHHQEILGALFCSQCGHILGHERDNSASDSSYWLYLIDHDHEIPLEEVQSFTIGRIDSGQSIIPDVDLSAYKAFEQGVSRMHATIKLGSELTITDLGSSNGTFINGVSIEAYIPHPFVPEDILTLGKMTFQIILGD
ncbi:MAG: FHA domain-containing protein [Anaerolineales bacterium]|nr:FHA domain-containing protein [Anaerolineales bacterium]